MSESCTHDCSTCNQDCGVRKELSLMPGTTIRHIVGVVSGKGGVGKSMVSGLLAKELQKKGYSVGILDADITGPSVPKMFGLGKEIFGDENGIFPAETVSGLKVVSINMMLDNEDVPVLWRGPILGNVIDQFYGEVYWGELDYLIIDMPPGTGDVAIHVIQSLPVDGFVMVTGPGKLVSMVVGKAINMAKEVKKEIFGLVENMAYVKCPDCGRDIFIYHDNAAEKTAKKYGLELTDRIPIDPDLADMADNGQLDAYHGDYLKNLTEILSHE